MDELLKVKRRFFRSGKERFLRIVEKELNDLGYECRKRSFWSMIFFRSVNLETKAEKPRYIFIAHYDTGQIVPFWAHWLMRLIGINRQILIGVILVVFMNHFIPFMGENYPTIGSIISALFFIPLLGFFIPASPNHNDNTSGVIALLQIARQLKEKSNDNAQFIFVDNEEWGLFGSLAQKSYMKRHNLIPEGCRIISIDCVGGAGDIPLLVRNGKSNYEKPVREAILSEFNECESVRMLLPASDNFSFRRYGAINISFVKRTLLPKGYYIQGIHSFSDRNIDLEKIGRLSNVLVDLAINDE